MQFKTKATTLLLLSAFSFFLTIAQEKSFYSKKISPYTAHLLYSVNESLNDSIELNQVQKRLGIKRKGNTQYINAYIEYNKEKENSVLSFLTEYNVEVNSIIDNIFTAKIPVQNIENISQHADIVQIEAAIPVFPQMNHARPASYIDAVQEGTELEVPYKGKDVVVGIIDGGFHYGHINFYNTDQTELRVKRVWNQNIKTDNNTPPSGYRIGHEYKTQEEILAGGYDYSSGTHGTHVAGIAAGADYSNNNIYYGVAPESDLVFVSYNTSNTDNVSLTDGIKYIYDYADKVEKPCVVNMSLGTHIGPHDGTSTFDQTCDKLQGEGKLLVGAVGNEGDANLHVSKTFTPGDNTLKTFISFNPYSRYAYIDIWSEKDKTFSIQAVVYNTFTKEEVYTTNILTANVTKESNHRLTESENGADGSIHIITNKNSKNQKANAFIYAIIRDIKIGHKLGIKITATDGTVHAWTESSLAYFSDNNLDDWTDGNSDYSMGEIGGTGERIISVGAYTTNPTYGGGTLNEIAGFSSKGPTPDGRLKPEITAPGASIISSYSTPAVENGGYGPGVVKTTVIGNTNYYYGYMQGTSMSAPLVTGVLATWLEAKNNLTPEEAKRVLQKTAIQDDYTGAIPNKTGDYTWGYGKINAFAGIQECIELKNIENNNPNKELIIYRQWNEKNLSVIFPEDDENILIHILSINKVMSSFEIDNVYRNQIVPLDLSNYTSGVYFLYVKGNNRTYNVEKFIIN